MAFQFRYMLLLASLIGSEVLYAEEDLFSLSMQELMSVDVYAASRQLEPISDAPGSVSVINAHVLQMFGITTIHEAMALVPGALPVQSGSYRTSISMRGAQFTSRDQHVLVLINGMPIRDVFIGGLNMALYSYVPIEQLERIEVIKGPGSVLYGTSAVSGVINLVTKKEDPDSFSAEVSVLGGTKEEYRLYGGLATRLNAIGLRAYGSVYQEPLWKEEFVLEDSTKTGLSLPRNGGAAGLMVDFGKTAIHTHLAFDSFTAFNTRFLLPLNDLNFFQMSNTVKSHVSILDNVQLHFKAGNTLMLWDGSSPARDGYSNEVLLEPSVEWNLPKFQFINGVTFALRSGNALEGVFDPMVADTVIPDFSSVGITGFTQIKWQALDEVQLVAAIQGGKVEDVKVGFHPRFGVNWEFQEHWMAKLYYGEAYRIPYALEFETNHPVIEGNRSLETERVHTLDAEVGYTSERTRVQARWFHSSYENIIRLNSDQLPLTYENRDVLDIHGFEVETHVVVDNNWYVTAGATLIDHHLDAETTVGELVPALDGFAGVSSSFSSWMQIGLLFQYRSEPIDAGSTDPETGLLEVDPTAMTKLDAHVMFTNIPHIPNTRVSIKASNLLGSVYRQGESNRPFVTALPLGDDLQFHVQINCVLP